jgi:AbrB family looped-hinge helix DNA binding protein
MATTKIDHFGRVLIPKPIRDNLGLDAGTELAVEEEGDRVTLRPTDHSPRLKRKGHVLVFAGGRATGDMTDIIRKVREERDRMVWGMDEP